MNNVEKNQKPAERSPHQGVDQSSDPLRWTPIFKPTEPGSVTPDESPRAPRSRLGLWIVLSLLLMAVLVGITQYQRLSFFLGAMGHLSSNHPADERLSGFIAFGLILVLIVAIVRILHDRREQ